MTDDIEALAKVVWASFSSSPFISITERDAQSIAATVIASDWFAARLADEWNAGADNGSGDA